MISEAVRSTPFLLGQILDRPAQAYPERNALEWEGGQLSYSALRQAVLSMEQQLLHVGAAKGQHWGLLLGNSPEFLVTLLALVRIGCIAVPLRVSLPAEKLAEHAALARLNALITQSDLPGSLAANGWQPEPEALEGNLRAYFSGCSTAEPVSSGALIDLDPALIMFSSGSSGRSRGVVLQHHAVLANLNSNIISLGLRDDDRTLLVLPISHAYALVHQCLCNLSIGATVCLPPNPLMSGLLHCYLENSNISTLSTVPPVFCSLVAGLERSRFVLPSLRLVTVGAAFADRKSVELFLHLMPHVQLAITYGLTEAGPRVATRFVQAGEPFDPHCVGTPLPNVSVELEPNSGGEHEIVVRSRSSMCAAFEKEHPVPFPDLALRTGDLGYQNSAETFLLGRSGRIINRGGVLVSAEQVEAALFSHPAVAAARVEAEAHQLLGEVPVATVTLAQGETSLTPEALKEYCATCLTVEERPYRFTIRAADLLQVPEKAREMSSLLK